MGRVADRDPPHRDLHHSTYRRSAICSIMSFPNSTKHHHQCCGIQTSFFERCGHTTTDEDHHPACEQWKAASTYLPPTLPPKAYSSQPRRFSPYTSAKSQAALKQPFPQTYPRCKDLHVYIKLVDEKCPSCADVPQIGLWNPNLSRFVSGWASLTEGEIFDRGVYYLNAMLQARETEYQGRLADLEIGMREQRNVDEAFRVPVLERTYGYDPSGAKGNFLGKPEEGEVSSWEKKCRACHQEMKKGSARRLPCGCILDNKCIRSWFSLKKSCCCCGVDFKLIKIPRREDTDFVPKYYPMWEDDDGYSKFA